MVRAGCSRDAGRWRVTSLLPLLLIGSAAADVIFRVPEVLVRHAAASKPVGTGKSNSSRNDSSPWGAPADDSLLEVHYEEYFVEHDVSTGDARRAAKDLKVEDDLLKTYTEINYNTVPASRPGCGACSARDVEYCETRVLADHCCCERRFVAEPFPWLPHTCYVGARRCRPLAKDCAQYVRLRNCCCYRKLAERWKGILSKSTRLGVSGVSLLLLSMLLFVAYL